MHSIKGSCKHIWALCLVIVLIIIVVLVPKDQASLTAGIAPSASTGNYTIEQVIELARALSPDCRLQKPPEPGGLG
ncbi:MAG TPA: hypothetical protein DCX22_01290 [Dehalococcoidia bacterium]|nr:hypothetical protein [Dehalococcoidia bacterium]